MIINIDSYRFYTTDPELMSYVKEDYNWLAPLHEDKNVYFYLEVMCVNAFVRHDINQLIPPDILERARRKEIILAIVNSGHGYHELVDNIYTKVILSLNVDPSQVLIISESADMHLEVIAVAEKYNVGKCLYQWATEFDYQAKRHSRDYPKVDTLQHKEYEKKFLSWNGYFRPHRSALVYLLECFDLLDKGYVSFNTKGGHPDHSLDWISHAMGYNEEFKKIMKDNFEKLSALPSQLFIDDPSAYRFDAMHPGDAYLYEDTYFSLVTETSFPFEKFHYGNFYNSLTEVGRILSEKIFKPIGMKHPFMVVSNPRTLELLRSTGYKTFSPWIDESYDLIDDDASRLIAIAKEAKRLCELNGEELYTFLTNCKEVCEYNYKVLQSKSMEDYRHNLI